MQAQQRQILVLENNVQRVMAQAQDEAREASVTTHLELQERQLAQERDSMEDVQVRQLATDEQRNAPCASEESVRQLQKAKLQLEQQRLREQVGYYTEPEELRRQMVC